MTIPRRLTVLAFSAAALAMPFSAATAGTADAASYHYTNCTKLHHDFKHGVGKQHAKDHHTSSSKAVTTFKRSTAIYKKAIAFNSDLDRDHDGIACEKR